MQVRKIDAKKMTAFDRYVKSKKLDKDSVRMAHDNPNHSMSKRMMKNKSFSKAVNMYKDAGMKESFVIPEDIPFKERNAFMGAAAAAHKAGKSHFNFGGKKHPVTMDKKVATKIADQKEGTDEAKRTVHSDKEDRLVTMKIKNPAPKKKAGETAVMNPKLGTSEKGKSEMEQKESTIRDKLIAVLEGDRAAHYKGATEPETMDDKLSGAGAKKMKADMEKGMTPNDTLKKAFDDVTKAGQAGPSMKARPNDKKDGDKKMPTPDDITKKAGMKEEAKRDSLAGIKAAYASMS